MNPLSPLPSVGALLRLAVLTGLALAVWVWPVWALTPKEQFTQADRAYAALQKNPRQQKYRDRWLACIEQFQKVHQLDPSGPWAAAGLYRSGLTYLELHKHSFLEADRQKGVAIFQEIIQRYPQSRYTPLSRSQLAALGKPQPPPQTTAATRHLKSAHTAYEALLASSTRQNHRDRWEACIDRFQAAYRADVGGPHAAEALYMIGKLYQGLAGRSHRQADRDTAADYFKRVAGDFPGTAYAEKALTELPGQPPAAAAAGTAEADPLAGIIARYQVDSAAENPDPEPARPGGLVTVQGLRFWSNPSYTRIVVDANQETGFTHHLLKKDPAIQKPQRLYIDMNNSRLGENIQKVIPINDELLSDARAGQFSADSVRIVVDIKSFKHYKIFSLKNPFRIVLDVWGQDLDRTVAAESVDAQRSPTGKLPAGAIARQLALGVRRIVIDPGHGGRDFGAPGYLKGVHEKTVVLQIAKRLARKVETELKIEALLTRSEDRFLTLEERTAIANTKNADLFISIHTNASRDRRAYGIETYFLNLATDDDAIMVAARENATSARNISDLESILNDLMKNAKINESSRLATKVQSAMVQHLGANFGYIQNKGVKQAPFYVLLGAQMPSILVEAAFISNPRECQRLTDEKYQEAVADGIIKGIRKYIQSTSPTAFFDPSAAADEAG